MILGKEGAVAWQLMLKTQSQICRFDGEMPLGQQTISPRNVQGKSRFKRRQQLASQAGVLAFSFQCFDDVALISQVARAVGYMPLGLRQVPFDGG
ncbi:hypothetical protein [Ensifer sp. ZNC0028]|uniref:hypothetical protein n=1 Tax=Ensifer sp. ZNC0028 TaxID=1339236 RepID=UPI0005BA8479|nr:hypothetical protein [Ensifer sp. ZNC0028]